MDPLCSWRSSRCGRLAFFPEDVEVFVLSAGELKEEFLSYPFINNDGCGFSSAGLPF